MGGTAGHAPSSSACSSSQPLCSAPAAVPSASKQGFTAIQLKILINGDGVAAAKRNRCRSMQSDGVAMHATSQNKGGKAIYPTLASTNLPSFLVDPCFLCAKDTTKKPAELEHACTGIVVSLSVLFSYTSTQCTLHTISPCIQLKGNYRAGTQKETSRCVHIGAK